VDIAPVKFVDVDSGDEAAMFVRMTGDSVGLALSLRRNGDIEVVFGPEELDRIIDALQTARQASLARALPKQ
jgi:hypothetical protein